MSRDLGRNANLATLEVDQAVALLVPAAAEAHRGAPVVIASAGVALFEQLLSGSRRVSSEKSLTV
jgi:hypothetical protein